MISCFLITQTSRALHAIRRYALGTCAGGGMCEAIVPIGEADLVLSEHRSVPELPIAPDDPRTPAHCDRCRRAFAPEVRPVIWQEPIYEASDGRQFTIRPPGSRLGELPPAPAGAMWVADWIEPGDGWTGPDGLCLMLRLPDGTDWMIDGPTRSGGGWSRTGTPPQITANPSIAAPGYHGWLRDGVLSDDLEGRSYGG